MEQTNTFLDRLKDEKDEVVQFLAQTKKRFNRLDDFVQNSEKFKSLEDDAKIALIQQGAYMQCTIESVENYYDVLNQRISNLEYSETKGE